MISYDCPMHDCWQTSIIAIKIFWTYISNLFYELVAWFDWLRKDIVIEIHPLHRVHAYCKQLRYFNQLSINVGYHHSVRILLLGGGTKDSMRLPTKCTYNESFFLRNISPVFWKEIIFFICDTVANCLSVRLRVISIRFWRLSKHA